MIAASRARRACPAAGKAVHLALRLRRNCTSFKVMTASMGASVTARTIPSRWPSDKAGISSRPSPTHEPRPREASGASGVLGQGTDFGDSAIGLHARQRPRERQARRGERQSKERKQQKGSATPSGSRAALLDQAGRKSPRRGDAGRSQMAAEIGGGGGSPGTWVPGGMGSCTGIGGLGSGPMDRAPAPAAAVEPAPAARAGLPGWGERTRWLGRHEPPFHQPSRNR